MLQAAGFIEITIDDSHPVSDCFTSVLVRAVTTSPTTDR
jgi:hypothetical protein